jgi:hypothetical protein
VGNQRDPGRQEPVGVRRAQRHQDVFEAGKGDVIFALQGHYHDVRSAVLNVRVSIFEQIPTVPGRIVIVKRPEGQTGGQRSRLVDHGSTLTRVVTALRIQVWF